MAFLFNRTFQEFTKEVLMLWALVLSPFLISRVWNKRKTPTQNKRDVAHFVAHSKAIVAMAWDSSDSLLLTRDKLGNNSTSSELLPIHSALPLLQSIIWKPSSEGIPLARCRTMHSRTLIGWKLQPFVGRSIEKLALKTSPLHRNIRHFLLKN